MNSEDKMLAKRPNYTTRDFTSTKAVTSLIQASATVILLLQLGQLFTTRSTFGLNLFDLFPVGTQTEQSFVPVYSIPLTFPFIVTLWLFAGY